MSFSSMKRVNIKIINSVGNRCFSIERVMGRQAANQFIASMELNNQKIDTPLISVSDPANVHDWEWSTGLDCVPKYNLEDLRLFSKEGMDPFMLVEKDITNLSDGIKELLGSDHPVLEACARYFFESDVGKKIRPTMVLAVSYALSVQRTQPDKTQTPSDLTRNPKNSPNRKIAFPYVASSSRMTNEEFATPTQRRLAEITEMIHTASLFHDDVIDKATTRRNMSAVNEIFGNKLAILGGDFLLSRASVSLARLRNLEVVELLSLVIEHLVKGEIMQMRPSSTGKSALEYYLRKNYYKTASLMGHSCLAAAVLDGHSEECKRASYLYGTYVGQAFQLVDDALDFEGSTSSLGKAPLADLKSGLATAPTLFAAEEHPQLLQLISRKFELPGDVELALSLVQASNGLQKCRELAQIHVEKAIEATEAFKPSPSRDALIALACKVITRSS